MKIHHYCRSAGMRFFALSLLALIAAPAKAQSGPDLAFWHDFEDVVGNVITPPVGPVANKTTSVIADQNGSLPSGGQHLQAPASGYATVDTNLSLLTTPSDSLSFSILYNAQGDNTGIHRLLTNYDGSGSLSFVEMLFDSVSGSLRLAFGSEVVLADDLLPQDFFWHQVGFRFDQGTVRFYVDGQPFGTDKVMSLTSVPLLLNDLHLIEDFSSQGVISEYFQNGEYDNAGLWTRAISDSEMAQLALPVFEPVTLFDHDFESISGDVIIAAFGPDALKTSNVSVDSIGTLEGSLQHVQAPGDGIFARIDTDVTLAQATPTLSFSLMVNARGDATGNHRFLSSYDGSGSVIADQLLFDCVGGNLRLIMNGETLNGSGMLPQDHDWHQVGFRFVEGEVRFFVDGQPFGSDLFFSTTFAVPAQTLPFALLEDPVSTSAMSEYYSDGDYDNAGLWLTPVTDEFMAARFVAADSNPFADFCNGDGGDQLGCTDCTCNNNAPVGTIGGCINQTGNSARLIAADSPSISALSPMDLSFDMTGGNPGTFAVLLSGDNLAPQNPANPCFGLGSGLMGGSVLDGLRCAVGAVQRHGGRPMDANGDVGLTTNGWGGPNGPMPSIVAQGGFVPGQTRYFQVFYRALTTQGCGTGQNSSQAVGVTFQP